MMTIQIITTKIKIKAIQWEIRFKLKKKNKNKIKKHLFLKIRPMQQVNTIVRVL